MKLMKIQKLIAAVALAALPFGLFANQAAAETANDTIDVYAGLAPVMVLTCNDVNFGVWRVPTGTRSGGETEIYVNAAGGVYIDGSVYNGGSIALSTNYNSPAAGYCNVSGSAADDGTVGQVSISNGGTGSFGTNGGTGYAGEALAAPTTALSSFNYALDSTPPDAMSGGVTRFTVRGSMYIPNGLAVANYGGYMAADVTVSYEDVNAAI